MTNLNFTDTTLAQASQHLESKTEKRNMKIIAFTIAIATLLFLSLPMFAKIF